MRVCDVSDKGFDLGDAFTISSADKKEKHLTEDLKDLKQEENVLKEEISERKEVLDDVKSEEKRIEHQLHTSHKKPDTKIDLARVWAWFVRNKALFLIIIPLVLSIWVRTGVMDLPIANDWAANNIYGFIRNDISAVVSAQYPNLPEESRNRLIDQQYNRAADAGVYTLQTGGYKGQNVDIKREIDQNAAQLKQFWQYDLNGKQVTYMPDIDPYFYLRYARNYIDHGYIGDYKDAQGREIDDHARAPYGTQVGISNIGIVPLIIAWVYQVHRIINPATDIMQSGALVPIVLVALSIIPAFLLGRRLAGDVGGFFVALMVAVNLAALGRTPWGHPDTDGFNLLFPMLIVWMSVESLRAQRMAHKLLWMAGAGLVAGLYPLAWSGWWYLFDFMLGAFAVQVLWTVIDQTIKHGVRTGIDPRKNTWLRTTLLLMAVFIIVAGVATTLTINHGTFISALTGPLRFQQIKNAAHENLWPNVYTTVAELNPGSVAAAIGSVGGNMFFTIALLGIIGIVMTQVVLPLVKSHGKETYFFESAILIFWFIGSIYATTKGIRFTLLLAPAFSVAFGVALGLAYRGAGWAAARLRIPRIIVSVLVIAAFCLLMLGPVQAAKSEAKRDVPIINDAWWNALTAIKDGSSKDAIINSWWDFGHHFKYIADRRVTFDGGSQNQPQAHWIGRTLLTDDEGEAIAILRMLDCGGNNAFNLVRNDTTNGVATARTVKQGILLDKEEARAYFIDQGVPQEDVERLLTLTHCEPPEDYFITSDDMIGKSGVWAHFGSWNFERSYAYIKHKGSDRDTAVDDLMTTLNYSKEQAENIYYDVQGLVDESTANSWIAPWPNYVSGPAGCSQSGSMLRCDNGVQINASNNEAIINFQGGLRRPRSIVYVNTSGEFVERTFNDSNVDISAAIIT
ncbi:MAG: STT3 domain-containing protein, partial [Nanoarchaeota archaeon]